MRIPSSTNITAHCILLLAAFLFSTGCEIRIEQPAPPVAETAPHEVQVPPAQAAVVGKGAEIEQQAIDASKDSRGKKSRSPADGNPVLLAQADSNANDHAPPEEKKRSPKPGMNFAQAMDLIKAEIRDSLELRKTLVVWLVEQTPQSNQLANDASGQISRAMLAPDGSKLNNLEMAVIGYAGTVNLITPDPLGDANLLTNSLRPLKDKKGDTANIFAALKMAVDKFLPYRDRGYEVMFVVVGFSSGDDLALANDVIASLKTAEVPVFGIGPAIPFGLPINLATAPKAQIAVATGGDRPSESLAPERILLALSGNETSGDLTDSSYGPFGLEWVCRLTGGKFCRLHGTRPAGWDIDPNTADVKSQLLDRYIPDYVDQQRYEQLLAENKCRMALHNAAQLPPTEGLESVTVSFDKQKDEAKMAQNVTTAQRAAADRDQPMQKLYDTMIVGEADRPKLTEPRWQAAYDLAMGQVLAAKARLDGYNALLAILKQGKAFTNPDSKRWVLEPADEIAASSVLDKMAKNSRVYLERVVKEHPGTPWAEVAKRELKHPAGWKIVEK